MLQNQVDTSPSPWVLGVDHPPQLRLVVSSVDHQARPQQPVDYLVAFLSLPVAHLQRQQPPLRLVDSSGFPKPVDSAATSTSTSAAAPGFGGGLFGSTQKPETFGTSIPVPQTTGGFSGGADGTAVGGPFWTTSANKDAAKPEEKRDATPTNTTSLSGLSNNCEKKDGAPIGTSTYGNRWLNVGGAIR